MRSRPSIIAVALAACGAGCGRFSYDPVVDAATTDDTADGPDPLLAGCVVYEPMDEASWSGAAGEVGDACGGDNGGTATGGATTVADAVRGRVGSFAGNDGCVVIPDMPALDATTALTMSAWVRPTALDGVKEFGVISRRVDYQIMNAYSLFLWTGDHVWVDVDTEDDRFSGVAALVNDQWRQVTVTYDGARAPAERVRVFLDGALDAVGAETSASITPFAADLYIGCLPLSGPAQGFVGEVDDAVVWTRALGDADVMAWYQQTRR